MNRPGLLSDHQQQDTDILFLTSIIYTYIYRYTFSIYNPEPLLSVYWWLIQFKLPASSIKARDPIEIFYLRYYQLVDA